MKKKIILSLLIIISLFTITGCGTKSNDEKKVNSNQAATIDNVKFKFNKERKLFDLTFKYSDQDNFKFTVEHDDRIAMKFFKNAGDDKKLASVIVSIRKNYSVENIFINDYHVKEDELKYYTYNNAKWYYTEYKLGNSKAYVYGSQNGNDTYLISFPQDKENENVDLESLKTTFMNNVSFK